MKQAVIIVAGRDPMLMVGGSDTYARALGYAALRAGYEPHFFCVGTATRIEEMPFGTIHCVRSPFRPIRGVMIAFHQPYVVGAVKRFAQERGFAPGTRCLIHSLGGWSAAAVAAARQLARHGLECRIAVTMWTTCIHEMGGKLRGIGKLHGTWTNLKLRLETLWTRLTVAPGERRALRSCDLVLVNYESVRRIVEDEYGPGLPFRKAAYASEMAFARDTREPVPKSAFLEALKPAGAPLILSVSRHDPRKGLDVLLRALALLRDAGVPFRACLAGGGGLLEQHRRFAAELGLSDCTVIPGRVPDAYSCLRHADVFVLPSIEEGSGSVSLLEAMQAGVAPVVSRVDGLPEDVMDGESALMPEPGDAAGLAHALRRLVEDPSLRARLAQRAQAIYRERFSAAAFAADLGTAYAGLGFAPASPRPAS
ncbi:MAG: glycosyltransferase family 4 protein [Alphaproteobacteria bacterium]